MNVEVTRPETDCSHLDNPSVTIVQIKYRDVTSVQVWSDRFRTRTWLLTSLGSLLFAEHRPSTIHGSPWKKSYAEFRLHSYIPPQAGAKFGRTREISVEVVYALVQ